MVKLTIILIALLSSSSVVNEDFVLHKEISDWSRCTFPSVERYESTKARRNIESLHKYIEINDEKLNELKEQEIDVDIDIELFAPDEIPSFDCKVMTIDDVAKAYESRNELSAMVDKARKQQQEAIDGERKLAEERRRIALERARHAEISEVDRTRGAEESVSVSDSSVGSELSRVSERKRKEDLIYNTLGSLPANTRQGISEFRIVDSVGGGRYSGLTHWPAGIVEIATNWSDEIIIDTVIHEVGHIFHFRNGLHYRDEWEQIFKEEWEGKGHYGSTNKKEAFAEAFEVVYSPNHDTDYARKFIPKSIDYIIKHVNSGI